MGSGPAAASLPICATVAFAEQKISGGLGQARRATATSVRMILLFASTSLTGCVDPSPGKKVP